MASMEDGPAESVARSRTFTNLRKVFKLKDKTVLDVGCSEGYYLQHFGRGSVGITLIDEHVEAGRRRGLTIVKANIENREFTLPQTFDVVWANNLFEHMNAPHLFLVKVREFLDADGTLILGVPVLPRLPFLTRLRKFRGAYAVSHVNFFTRRTLIETICRGGWTVQQARPFYFKNILLDSLLNIIAPHIYVVARADTAFTYAEKRMKSLREYGDTNQ
ncbi:class I SAM-dependent methyltransferase [Candidatus Wolfebacteria bacterium]|nr:class I SAM-dependent methyltransferase [Candidatus Wolfebacteria bacterium]